MKPALIITALTALLATQLFTPRPTHLTTPPGTHASWVNLARNLDEAVKLSQTVVVATVIGVKRASDLTVKAPGEPGGLDRVPAERVLLRTQAMYGSAPSELTLFHTGLSTGTLTSQTPPADPRKDYRPEPPQHGSPRQTILEDDPEYRVGEQYVLFLRPGPTLDGQRTLRVIAPEGRYHLKADGTLQPVTDRGAAKEISSLTFKQLAEKLRAQSQIRLPNIQLPSIPLVPPKP